MSNQKIPTGVSPSAWVPYISATMSQSIVAWSAAVLASRQKRCTAPDWSAPRAPDFAKSAVVASAHVRAAYP
jgi:hypothetical protein